jgi:hypothetical protein
MVRPDTADDELDTTLMPPRPHPAGWLVAAALIVGAIGLVVHWQRQAPARSARRPAIMRLSGGGLVVCSPLAIDDATATEIDALGERRFFVAPSLQR